MRLALVYDVAYPFVEGGGQKRMYEVARRFGGWGWDVHWYCLKTWEGAAVRQLGGITYHGLQGHTNFYASDGTRSRRAALSFGRAVLFADVRFAEYDIVWCGQWPYFHILALFARLTPWRTRLLVDWWEVWGGHWTTYIGAAGIIGRALEWVLANLVARAGRAVVISDRGLAQIMALGAPRQGLACIPNGVNSASLEDAKVAEGNVDIASFGRIKDHKNIDHIVLALKFVKEHSGRRLTADIIGDGPELENIKVLAAAIGVADQICFHGRVDDARLASLLKRAKIFVHPSTKEAEAALHCSRLTHADCQLYVTDTP